MQDRRPTHGVRTFWAVATGMLLLELAWIVALPAFRGLDEFAHALRADSLVHGQLLSRTPDPEGTGQLVTVRRGLADAARPQCTAYVYTTHADCYPVSSDDRGRVVQSSTAASYDPLWYAVAGGAAAPFDGAAALFVMRAVTALGTAALVGWAAAIVARWDSSGWMLAGLLLAFTPIAVYSGGVAAPNGIAYGAGLVLAASAASLLARPHEPRLRAVVVSATLVAHTHTTGMMWLAVLGAALLLARSPRWWLDWVREDTPRRTACLAGVGLAGLTALGWVRWAHTNAVGAQDASVPLPSPSDLAEQLLVWFFQTVGAFPDRTTPAPLGSYALWLAPTLILLATAVRRADRGERRALAWMSTCWCVVPIVLTLVSYRAISYAWQGRYALPLVEAVVLLAASAVARSRRPPPARLHLVVPLLAAAQVWSVVTVARSQEQAGLGYALTDHLPHAAWIVGTLALVGGLLPLAIVRTGTGRAAPTQESRPAGGAPTGEHRRAAAPAL
ncbi:MAG: hypothetical protein JWR42_1963 [Marmoricola sp.]|nr:hypothetical protein [Marmoricola sp.]